MPTGPHFRVILAHALAWGGFILYEVSIVIYTSGPLMASWWEYTGYYGMNITLFYVHAHLVLATALRSKSTPYLLLLLIPLELGLYILLEFGLEQLFNLLRPEPIPVLLDQRFIVGYIWRGSYFIGLSTTYWFVRRTIRNHRKISRLEVQQLEAQKERAVLEKDLIKSQNAYLQAQINPHFLFNTLNFLYNQVENIAPKASEGVLLLSEVMRYTLTGVQEDGKAELADEIVHLKHYITLNQLRFRNPLHLNFQVEGQVINACRIPPLVLMTFVENMFKHGDMTDPLHPGCVRVCCEAGRLIFNTRNKKRLFAGQQGMGIGMLNVKTRLSRLYAEQDYVLSVCEDDAFYAVHFQIKLL